VGLRCDQSAGGQSTNLVPATSASCADPFDSSTAYSAPNCSHEVSHTIAQKFEIFGPDGLAPIFAFSWARVATNPLVANPRTSRQRRPQAAATLSTPTRLTACQTAAVRSITPYNLAAQKFEIFGPGAVVPSFVGSRCDQSAGGQSTNLAPATVASFGDLFDSSTAYSTPNSSREVNHTIQPGCSEI
jgi:hypothetical protein